MKLKLDYIDTINLKSTVHVLRRKNMSFMNIVQILRMEYEFQDEHGFKMVDDGDNRQEYTNGIQI